MPMSIRNVDRHGLENLRLDPVKPLDRLKIPPWIIYMVVFGGTLYVAAKYFDNEELQYH